MSITVNHHTSLTGSYTKRSPRSRFALRGSLPVAHRNASALLRKKENARCIHQGRLRFLMVFGFASAFRFIE